MNKDLLLDPILILKGAKQTATKSAVLIVNNLITAFGKEAQEKAKQLGIIRTPGGKLVFAPCLVDPHSFLTDYLNGRVETLNSLKCKAASAGYGQIAILPKAMLWRDKPEHLIPLINTLPRDVLIHLWGGFSQGGKGKELSPHKDLINYGAIGLAENESMITPELLQKAILLGESQGKPILVAPKDSSIQGHGMVREGVEALRSGWHQDPITSETVPLTTILEIQRQNPEANIRVMNISTSAGVSILANSSSKPMASVCWWHLVSDQSKVGAIEIGINVSPSLGNPHDRKKLIEGLENKIITGVSVHAIALDETETNKPTTERTPGLSSYHLVLPSLWQELIEKSNWSIEQLWEAISFGPSKILKLPAEKLEIGSNRWLLFDPTKKWVQKNNHIEGGYKSSSNQPWEGKQITGKVIACGLNQQS